MVNLDLDNLSALAILWKGESDSDVGKILGEFACCRNISAFLISLLRLQFVVPRGPSTVTIRDRM